MKHWTPQQKLLHDMKVVNGYAGVRSLLNIMAVNDNKKVEEILVMIKDIGIEESYNILNNQIIIKNQQHENVVLFGKANNITELKEWYRRASNNY